MFACRGALLAFRIFVYPWGTQFRNRIVWFAEQSLQSCRLSGGCSATLCAGHLSDIRSAALCAAISEIVSAAAFRKKKAVHKATTTDDKRLQGTLKRLNVNTIPSIEEVMLIKEDLVTVFNNPKGVFLARAC